MRDLYYKDIFIGKILGENFSSGWTAEIIFSDSLINHEELYVFINLSLASFALLDIEHIDDFSHISVPLEDQLNSMEYIESDDWHIRSDEKHENLLCPIFQTGNRVKLCPTSFDVNLQ